MRTLFIRIHVTQIYACVKVERSEIIAFGIEVQLLSA